MKQISKQLIASVCDYCTMFFYGISRYNEIYLQDFSLKCYCGITDYKGKSTLRIKNFIISTSQIDEFLYSVHTLLKANTNIFVHIFDEKIIPPDNVLDMLSQAPFYAAEF